jgi:outer membrane protein OmpA-like peptidoglycan-associated protein
MTTTTLRIRRAAILLGLAAALFAPAAHAQSGSAMQVEVGLLGTYTNFDNSNIGLESSFGAGGVLGLYFSRTFSLEAFGDYSATNDSLGFDVNVARLGATFVAHTRPTVLGSLYIGLGYNRIFYTGSVDVKDNAGYLILGDRFSLGGRVALRIEGRLDYIPNAALSPTNGGAVNFGAAAGISIFAFGGPARDADKDGVPNTTDQCPDTPRGATVDAVGCPMDSDGDGVFDGIDECPNTPAGAFVNEKGCPTDTDSDGVFDGIDVCPNTPAGAAVDENGCPMDTDQDGVFDGLDQCPDTPLGASVDAQGCPLDSDGDGVFDGIDQCPDTPPGTTVDATGCPADSDGDGVIDDIDQCPDTPAGFEVDERGCPIERDSDGDGVPDSRDRCPNTASGQEVDEVGCPILFVVEQGVVQALVLRGVNFATNRSALTAASYSILDVVASSLLAHPDVRIEIAGHTDITGRHSYNMRLSQQRAQAVKAYLARKGVDPSRMVAVGYGPDQPIADNATPAGRSDNRRVELRLLEGGPR